MNLVDVNLSNILSVIETSILPLTKESVNNGNKIFGASILNKVDCSELLSGVNNEIESPLWHGEMSTLQKFYQLKTRPSLDELVFFSSHEPCSMCLSAITWAGFKHIFYFFSYQDSKNQFFIPHDLKIMKEVFKLKDGSYRRKNSYWECHAIDELITFQPIETQKLYLSRFKDIKSKYEKLSEVYQKNKNQNSIPLN